jgi:hypothetical protein
MRKTVQALLIAGVFVSALFWRSESHAQVDEAALKAAFIFNFTVFVTWPPGALADGHVVVCVGAGGTLTPALQKLSGRAANGMTWVVRVIAPAPGEGGANTCNVVVVSGADAAARALRSLAAARQPVLVIGTDEEAAQAAPGILLFRDGDHVRFDIDNSQLVRRNLVASSRLLSLARSIQ